MACGHLLDTRIASLRECSSIAAARGLHFFSYNKWWQFCLGCTPQQAADCAAPPPDASSCHYQVGFGVYQQRFGASVEDLPDMLIADGALAAEELGLSPEAEPPWAAGLSASLLRSRQPRSHATGTRLFASLSLGGLVASTVFAVSWARRRQAERRVDDVAML